MNGAGGGIASRGASSRMRGGGRLFLAGVAAAAALLCGCASKTDRLLAELIAQELKRSNGKDEGVPAAGGAKAVPEDAAPDANPDEPTPPLSPVRTAARVTIQPESIVQIDVKEDAGLTGSYEANASSAIQLGSMGLVFLSNMTAEEAATQIKRVLEERGFRSATVSVRIVKASYDTVRVSGAVNIPTDMKIGPGSEISLREALRRAGGLRTQAQGAKVKVMKEGLLDPLALNSPGEEYPLVDAKGTPGIPEVQLANNDWVYVSSGEVGTETGMGEKRILVLGEVGKPGVVTFGNSDPCTMLHLMLKLGELPRWADTRKVQIIRRDQNGAETRMAVNIERLLEVGDPADDVPLENGDRVVVPERRLLF